MSQSERTLSFETLKPIHKGLASTCVERNPNDIQHVKHMINKCDEPPGSYTASRTHITSLSKNKRFDEPLR